MAYELPDDLGAQTPEQLQGLIDAGLDALRALGVTDESPDDVLAEGERLVALLDQLRVEVSNRDAATARATRVQAVRQVAETPTESEEPAEPETPEQPETPETGEQPDADGGEAVTPDEVIEPVAASTSPARRAAVRGSRPQVPRQRAGVAALTAAADVPGIPTGAPLDGLTAAADALIRRARGLPNTRIGGPDGVRHRYGAAVIHLDGYGEGLVQGPQSDDYAMVWRAGDETRLPGNSLVAAGGWCAPSETLYDMCQYEQVDGILDVPEIGITRGGIRWTPGPDFSDIYDACGFELTEAEAVAGTAQKNCCEVECPDFDEIRLDAIGLCVKTPLLTNSAYPELVRRFMEGALVAHQHKVNKYVINAIAAAAGTSIVAPDTESLSISMQILELTAVGMRYRYRMAQNASIEVVAPFWLKVLMRIDLGMRQFPPEISDAAINGWFSQRNMSVQWVYDYQDLQVNGCDVEVPSTATVLLYPAGTWVRGRSDVINIDAVYDSTGLSQNVFTALFMEEGILAVQRCTHTCAVEIPICISGRTAANDLSACLTFAGTAAAPSTGATAGAPATWTPASSNPPQSDMTGITASPATAWTAGQYARTDSGAEFHWDGNSWEPGRA